MAKKRGQNCRERSGETETRQPTKTEKRNGYHKTEKQKGHGQRQLKERLQWQKRRKVHLKTQHGRQEENGWERESKMEIVE